MRLLLAVTMNSLLVTSVLGQHESWTRGTHYAVNTTMGYASELQFLSHHTYWEATYVSGQVADELRILDEDFGVDNLRVFGSLWGWRVDPDMFIENLEEFADMCAARDIGIQFVLWSSAFDSMGLLPVAEGGQDLVDEIADAHDDFYTMSLGAPLFTADPQLHGEPWQMSWRSEPGNMLFTSYGVPSSTTWPSTHYQDAEAYVLDVAAVFANRPQLDVVFDLFNEPDAMVGELVPVNVAYFIEDTYDWVEQAYVGAGHAPGYTVGFARAEFLEENLTIVYDPDGDAGTPPGVDLTVVGFHSYLPPAQSNPIPDPTPVCYDDLDDFDCSPVYFEEDVTIAEAEVAAVTSLTGGVLPLMCTEFYAPYFDPDVDLGMLRDTLVVLGDHGIPGQIWGFLASNVLMDYDIELQLASPPLYIDGLVRPTVVGGILDPYGEVVFGEIEIMAGFPATTEEIDDLTAFKRW